MAREVAFAGDLSMKRNQLWETSSRGHSKQGDSEAEKKNPAGVFEEAREQVGLQNQDREFGSLVSRKPRKGYKQKRDMI